MSLFWKLRAQLAVVFGFLFETFNRRGRVLDRKFCLSVCLWIYLSVITFSFSEYFPPFPLHLFSLTKYFPRFPSPFYFSSSDQIFSFFKCFPPLLGPWHWVEFDQVQLTLFQCDSFICSLLFVVQNQDEALFAPYQCRRAIWEMRSRKGDEGTECQQLHLDLI